MTEIKFRGKDYQGKWHYGSLVIYNNGDFAIAENDPTWTDDGYHNEDFELIKIKPETAGQFTNQKDKNDKEVFVGDIATDGLSLYTVEFSEESCSFVWHRHGSYNTYHFKKTDTEEMEIIGNIHDNPELISK